MSTNKTGMGCGGGRAGPGQGRGWVAGGSEAWCGCLVWRAAWPRWRPDRCVVGGSLGVAGYAGAGVPRHRVMRGGSEYAMSSAWRPGVGDQRDGSGWGVARAGLGAGGWHGGGGLEASGCVAGWVRGVGRRSGGWGGGCRWWSWGVLGIRGMESRGGQLRRRGREVVGGGAARGPRSGMSECEVRWV